MARQALPQLADPASQQRQATKLMQMLAWKKMNTKVARQNLPPDEVAWAENLQPISPNVWRTVPAPNAALATVTGKTATRLFFVNLNGVDYIYFCATDGSMTAINAVTGAQSTVFNPGSLSSTPDLTVFSSQFVLVMDPQGGYAGFNGTVIFFSGTLSPIVRITNGGAGYTSAPAVSFTGGSGGNAGGATATATIAGGAVVSVTMTNTGGNNAAGAPITVVFTGGGFSTPATATVVVWPQVKGNTIDVFSGRVWWASLNAAGAYRILNFTGTQGIDDINPANAAGSTTISDSDLVHGITVIRNRNNFLYIFGDQSIKQIGSITVSSSITLFNILTLASDVGTTLPMTVQSYNRIVVFANKSGVWGIFGATVSKISDDLDGIFQLIDWTLSPSSSVDDIHATITAGGSLHCYLLLVRYIDPVQGTRTIICVYQKDQWFVINQGNALLAICGAPLASTTQWETFASSGADMTQLLQQVAANVTVLFQTALSGDRSFVFAKKAVRAGAAITSSTPQTIQMSLDTENSSNAYSLQVAGVLTFINNQGLPLQFVNNSSGNIIFTVGGFRIPRTDMEGYGKVMGSSISGSVMNLSINAVVVEYTEEDMWGDSP